MKREEILLRDPFVLVHEGKYYLYGTRSETAFIGEAYGFDVYVSSDLNDWSGPYEVFHRPENFFSKKSYWAPEVHLYQERFYMFATFADTKHGLGTAVLVADTPMGPFTMWSDGYITPKKDRCLDGTLYISRDGIPYLVYCHEWRQIHDGSICALRLRDDLKVSIGEPTVLFHASQARPYVKKYMLFSYVTDGPFLKRTTDGKLHMLWSTYTASGYAEVMAHSDTDEITGHWMPDAIPLYGRDGGHGMIFENLNGEMNLVLHYPNAIKKEHPRFLPLEYSDGKFVLGERKHG